MRGSLRSCPEARRLEDVLATRGLVLFSLDCPRLPGRHAQGGQLGAVRHGPPVAPTRRSDRRSAAAGGRRQVSAGGAQFTASIRVAVNSQRKGADGDNVERTDWFRVRTIGSKADYAQRFTKDQRDLVAGRLDISEWHTREGDKRTFVRHLGRRRGEPVTARAWRSWAW